MYRFEFFDTCKKLDSAHSFFFERVRNRALRTECQKNTYHYVNATAATAAATHSHFVLNSNILFTVTLFFKLLHSHCHFSAI